MLVAPVALVALGAPVALVALVALAGNSLDSLSPLTNVSMLDIDIGVKLVIAGFMLVSCNDFRTMIRR